MRNIAIIARREFKGYFATPLALVFIVIFLALTGAFAFYVGGFFSRGNADLTSFFGYHPWLFLLLVPAIGMRLWAEERKSGTIELLMTLPVSTLDAVLGKYLAAWAFCGLALALTFPMWITVNVLGSPDNGVILTSYVGSFTWLVPDLTKGLLDVQPKDAQGRPLVDLEAAIIDSDPTTPGVQEYKEWQGLLDHVRGLPDLDGDGLADIPVQGAAAEQRMLREPSLHPAALYRYAGPLQWGASLLLVAVLLALCWFCARLRRSRAARLASA